MTTCSARGAAQLHKDFQYLRDFIDVHFNEISMKSRILQATQMGRFDMVIQVLADQPVLSNKRTINTSLSSRNRVAPLDESSNKFSYDVTEKAQWTSLRAGIPFTKTLFPCLPSSLTDGC